MAWLGQIFGAYGKSPDAFPGRGENRVAHGRGDHWQSGLADAGGLFLAHHHVDFRHWSCTHPRHLVIVEIRLLNTASLDGDGVMQSRRKAIDGRTFHLRADSFRIDGAAAIDRVNEAVHLHGPVLHARFRKDRKSTRLNSSHTVISYAVFCLKNKKCKSAAQTTARL